MGTMLGLTLRTLTASSAPAPSGTAAEFLEAMYCHILSYRRTSKRASTRDGGPAQLRYQAPKALQLGLRNLAEAEWWDGELPVIASARVHGYRAHQVTARLCSELTPVCRPTLERI